MRVERVIPARRLVEQEAIHGGLHGCRRPAAARRLRDSSQTASGKTGVLQLNVFSQLFTHRRLILHAC
jgi:hypothetical protein